MKIRFTFHISIFIGNCWYWDLNLSHILGWGNWWGWRVVGTTRSKLWNCIWLPSKSRYISWSWDFYLVSLKTRIHFLILGFISFFLNHVNTSSASVGVKRPGRTDGEIASATFPPSRHMATTDQIICKCCSQILFWYFRPPPSLFELANGHIGTGGHGNTSGTGEPLWLVSALSGLQSNE